MKKTIKINVPPGCDSIEIVLPDDVKVNPVLKVEADRLPYSWEEFCEKYSIQMGECLLDKSSSFYEAVPGRIRHKDTDKACLPDRETAEAFIALMQLIQLRNCYNGGWEPDWTDGEIKYTIMNGLNNLEKARNANISHVLAFKSEELRDQFLENFRDLIEIAKPLL